jgi:isoquinoline 1-oxidoreductase alpha subunit
MPRTRLELQVNGRAVTVDTDPQRPLLEVLREDLDLTGTKYGCGEGACRACTVLLDGKAVTSCRVGVGSAVGKAIVTIEGLAGMGGAGGTRHGGSAAGEHAAALHPVQQAFLDAGAMQCGYCVPGMILTTVALLERNARPSREEIVDALDGNLCRCCGYGRMLEAVERAARGGVA